MSVEWSDNLNSLLPVLSLLHLNLLGMVENSLNLDWLHRPLCIELGIVTPWEAASILWCDINWLLTKKFSASSFLSLLLLSTSALVLSSLMDEH